jgi:hypothetical protein
VFRIDFPRKKACQTNRVLGPRLRSWSRCESQQQQVASAQIVGNPNSRSPNLCESLSNDADHVFGDLDLRS